MGMSYKQLNYDERIELATLHTLGFRPGGDRGKSWSGTAAWCGAS